MTSNQDSRHPVPVAKDLRIVVSALRMSASLERMGSLASSHRRNCPLPLPRQQLIPDALRGTFEEMSKLDVELADKAVEL